MRETHQVHCGGCRNNNTFHDFDFMTTELIFCKYRRFQKSAKHIVLSLTSILSHETDKRL